MALRELLAIFDVVVNSEPIKNANKQLDQLVDKAGKAEKSLSLVADTAKYTLAFAAIQKIVGGITSFITEQIELGSQLQITSERLGLSTEELQRYQFEAQQSGVETESLTQGLGFLNRAIGKAAEGDKGVSKVFSRLGLSVRDSAGNVKTLEQLVPEVADAIQGMGNQGERTTNMMLLMGRGGAKLLPFFQKGSKGIEEMGQAFDETGGALDKNYLAKTREAAKQNAKWDHSLMMLKATIVGQILPGLMDFWKWITKTTVQIKEFMDNGSRGKDAFNFLIGGMLLAAVTALSAGFTALAAAMGLTTIELGFWAIGLVVAYLVYNELTTAMRGGNTILAETLKDWGLITDKIQFAKDLSVSMNASWDLFLNTLKMIAGIIGFIANRAGRLGQLAVTEGAAWDDESWDAGGVKSGNMIIDAMNGMQNAVMGPDAKTVTKADLDAAAYAQKPSMFNNVERPEIPQNRNWVQADSAARFPSLVTNITVNAQTSHPDDVAHATKGAVDDSFQQHMNNTASMLGGEGDD